MTQQAVRQETLDHTSCADMPFTPAVFLAGSTQYIAAGEVAAAAPCSRIGYCDTQIQLMIWRHSDSVNYMAALSLR
jgi:hypothetical protein